jgi:hypothetical protein
VDNGGQQMSLKRIGDLEIDEDFEWERGEWTFERIGWGLMALFLLAAMLGFFGTGPFSSRTAGEEGGLFWVDYQRFVRFNSPQELNVYVDPQLAQNGQMRLVIGGDFPHTGKQIDVSPEPDSVELSTGQMIYSWQVSEATGPMQISFHFYPMAVFSQRSIIGPEGAEEVELNQFVYP